MSSDRLVPRARPGWRRTALLPTAGALVALLLLAAGGRAAGPRFYPDDPLEVDNDRALDASGAKEIEASDYLDFAENTFFSPGEQRDIPAVNVNTLDEVPDSTWFTNRIGRRAMSIEEIVRGPDRVSSISIDEWPIVRDKGEGRQPGYRVVDPTGHLYQIEFDPPSNPEMATGAETIGTALYHALGYNVVEVYVVEIDPAKLVISPKATARDRTGKRRPMTMDDVNEVLRQAAKGPDGKYRALASRFADGAPMGSFKYYGTRPDDPNDIFMHEHRRELRGNRVFAAWLNHDDSRGLNSLDMLEGPENQKYIKHYMFDFGSIMGSGTIFAQVPRAGNEYIYEWGPSFLTLGTLGLYIRPWLTVDYPDMPPSVGRFESEFFRPEEWRPEYPNTAFLNMRPEDAFWAARIVAKFSDEAIRAVVAKARYSDPRASEYITKVLIERRDKVLRTWLNGVNPVVNARLDDSGRLTFENAAVSAGMASAAAKYTLAWSRFDNATDTHEPIGAETSVIEPAGQAPSALLNGSDYVAVAVTSLHPQQPRWAQPVRFYFRRSGGGWQTVGLERMARRGTAQTNSR